MFDGFGVCLSKIEFVLPCWSIRVRLYSFLLLCCHRLVLAVSVYFAALLVLLRFFGDFCWLQTTSCGLSNLSLAFGTNES